MNPQDLFEMMGGGMGGMGGFPMGGMGGGMHRKRKTRDIGVRYPIGLDVLYKGGKREIELPRVILCKNCKGTGAKDAKSHECGDCHGRGTKLIRRMLGPGMVQQMQVHCDTCGGEGSSIREQDKCQACSGQKTKEVQRKLNVQITPGMEDGTRIPFEGEGDEHPEMEPGSVIIVLQEEQHEKFKRDGDDLCIEQTISLKQALLGLTFELEHLDGRKLYVNAPQGTVITPGYKMCIKGEGMPNAEGGPGRGDLIVSFHLEFPRTIGDDQVELFKKCLPGPQHKAPIGEDPEECFMDDYSPEDWQRMGVGEDEEEDAEEDGQPGVACSHQ